MRRAGSSQTPSNPSRANPVASALTTRAFRHGMRFTIAAAAVVSSSSTAVTSRSSAAIAIASDPSPHPKSATRATPART